MRMALVGCALVLAASVESAAAQDGWPWTHYPSLRKQAAPKKRAQPPVPVKTEPAEAAPAATAALDPQTPSPRPAAPQAQPADAQPPPADPQAQPPAVDSTASDRALATPWQWRIMRTTWTERDEKGFEEFVHRIGESGCR